MGEAAAVWGMEPVDMIGGFSLKGAECWPRGEEQIVGENSGGGVKVGVQRFSSRGPDMLTWKQWYVTLSWDLVMHPKEGAIYESNSHIGEEVDVRIKEVEDGS